MCTERREAGTREVRSYTNVPMSTGGRSAIIGGTGVEVPAEGYREQQVDTPYGTALVYAGPDGAPLFLSRHGVRHDIPPHLINYRANIAALSALGVDRVLSTLAVGSVSDDVQPGLAVLIDQLLDFTTGRAHTFFEGGESGLKHVDVTEPFCPHLRARLRELGPRFGLAPRPSGTYVCTNGPRLETAAEIRLYRMFGAHVVGMTAAPEAFLARERGLHYAAVAVSINWGAGLREAIRIEAGALDGMRGSLLPLLTAALADPLPGGCPCGGSR